MRRMYVELIPLKKMLYTCYIKTGELTNRSHTKLNDGLTDNRQNVQCCTSQMNWGEVNFTGKRSLNKMLVLTYTTIVLYRTTEKNH